VELGAVITASALPCNRLGSNPKEREFADEECDDDVEEDADEFELEEEPSEGNNISPLKDALALEEEPFKGNTLAAFLRKGCLRSVEALGLSAGLMVRHLLRKSMNSAE
jgi:hypothetical protein